MHYRVNSESEIKTMLRSLDFKMHHMPHSVILVCFLSYLFSLDECRRILDIPELVDDQVEEICDTLYAFAHIFIDEFLDEKRKGITTPTGIEPCENGNSKPSAILI